VVNAIRALRIACLGWGSLVWDPRELPIRREWFKDGPFAPVEFTGRSSDGRVTLVIDPTATPVRLLWAHMFPVELSVARKALRDREGIKGADWASRIGSWQFGNEAPVHIPDLPKWAEAHGLDAAVWTALEPRFLGKDGDTSPSIDEVIDYLRGLVDPVLEHAKEYIERAPRQIDTNFRRQIETAMGWSRRDNFGG
jgi:hypothetical protein